MTILEVIKKGIKYADGFTIREESGDYYITTPARSEYIIDERVFKASFYWKDLVFPLLLTRIIEGINRDGEFEIISHEGYIDVLYNDKYETFFHDNTTKSIDEAKLSAITYVLEQESR